MCFQLASVDNWVPDVDTGRAFAHSSYLGPFMSISPFIEDDVSYYSLCYDITIILQKELSSHYTDVNIQQAIAAGASLIQVMETTGVSVTTYMCNI